MIDRARLNAWTIAAAEGDRSAIDPLFRALWRPSVAYAMHMLGDQALAEDCAQVGLARMFANLDRFERSRDALTWALTHVTWECRTARTTRRRRAEVSDEHAVQASADGVELIEHRDLVRAAVIAIGELPAASVETIAASISGDRGDIPPATFRKRLERALARLRISWRARHDPH